MKEIKSQRGASLLEILVSLAIGIILLLALATLMVVANRSSAQRTTSELLDETARQVFSRLESDLRQAGYVDVFANDNTMQTALNGTGIAQMARYGRLRGQINDVNRVSLIGQMSGGRIQPLIGCNTAFADDLAANAPAVCPDGAPTTRQSIQISYQAVRGNNATEPRFHALSTVAQETNSQSAWVTTCSNQNATQEFPIIVNRYFVDREVAPNLFNLFCDSTINSLAPPANANRTAQQPLTLGIEQIVFRYLMTPEDAAATERPNLRTTVSGRSVVEYLSADQVQARPLSWAGVVGVEVCLIVAAEPLDGTSESEIANVQPQTPSCLRANANAAADAPWAAPDNRPPGDTRVYRRYVRTISIPNSLFLLQ